VSQLIQLYQELILEHSRHPRCYGSLPTPPAQYRMGANPMCGDKLKLFVQIDDQHITDIRFEGDGCAIFKASCSLLSEAVLGKTLPEADIIVQAYLHHVTKDEAQTDESYILGKLAVFSGVRKYPVRVKCATLVARTLQSVLHDSDTNAIISSDGHL